MRGERGNGAQGRNRTTDTVIFSHVLYQLSYLGARKGWAYRESPDPCPVGGAGRNASAGDEAFAVDAPDPIPHIRDMGNAEVPAGVSDAALAPDLPRRGQ